MTKKQKNLSDANVSRLSSEFKRDAIAKIYAGKPLTGKDGVFSDMIKEVLETALSEELNQHIAAERLELGKDFNNRKNGHNSKTLKTRESSFTLDAPRERPILRVNLIAKI